MTDIDPILDTEMRNEKSDQLHQFSTMEIIALMNEEDQKVPHVIKRALPDIAAVIDATVKVLQAGGHLYYFGAGTSGRLGVLDASECPPTFGVPHELVNGIIAGGDRALRYPIENAEDSKEEGATDVRKYVGRNDMVIGIASSGKTPYVLGAMEAARALGAQTASIACNASAELSHTVHHPIELAVGAEVVTGSTRLKAGSAQKMVLNMISTASMIKMGKVYKNLMVNVQASNEKLRKRAISIIRELTGVDEERAAEASNKAQGDARIAILMLLLEIDAETARRVLEQKKGHFPDTVEAMTQAHKQADNKNNN
ncbi:N-acetylmuramic acid 6-phosphate etherase [Thalassobacillus sp. CUG 92003]|uniref:N-acetylmuramic acid 6-phosphate etherase n=1 Tax=Thalassobacillus sp. CUG 92003 TaxID=2736641 RepID=UPI0015E64B67|nr:N-acetylmuramic acid 6-phosphate etherase [Thalassobacillus sp. CUG 92003]